MTVNNYFVANCFENGANQNFVCLFRSTVAIEQTENLSVVIATNGIFKLFVNGLPVFEGNADFNDGKAVTEKIDEFLMSGENVFAVECLVENRDKAELIFDLLLDGKSILTEQPKFLFSRHTGFGDDIFLKISGTDCDDFESPFYQDDDWKQSVLKQATKQLTFVPKLCDQPVKPINITSEKKAVCVDFENQASGYIFLSGKGQKGDCAKILLYEQDSDEPKAKQRWQFSGQDDIFYIIKTVKFKKAEIFLPNKSNIELEEIRFIKQQD